MTETMKKLGFVDKFGYLCSGISYSMCMLIPTFLIYFATERLAISIAVVSLMMALVKIFDAVTDVAAGIIIDKTKSKHGKARPWFLRAGIPYAVCLVLMFSVPAGLGDGAKLVLLTVFYALTVSVFGTMIGVARYAIVPRMTSNPKEQGILGVLGDGVGVVIVGLGMAVIMNMVAVLGWTGTFGIFAIIALVTALFCFALTKERTEEISAAIDAEKAEKKLGAKEFATAIFKNKYALLLLLAVFLQQLGSGAINAGGTYYFQYVQGDMTYFNLLFTIATVLCLIGMVVCTFINKAIGPKKVFMIGGIGAVICYIIVFLGGNGNPMLVSVTLAFAMLFAQTFVFTCFASFSASAVAYGEKKNGVRAEGVTSSVINIGIKVGTALSTAIIGLIMAVGGYVEGGVEQTAQAIATIKNVYIFFPLVCFIIMTVVIAVGFTYKKDMAKLGVEVE